MKYLDFAIVLFSCVSVVNADWKNIHTKQTNVKITGSDDRRNPVESVTSFKDQKPNKTKVTFRNVTRKQISKQKQKQEFSQSLKRARERASKLVSDQANEKKNEKIKKRNLARQRARKLEQNRAHDLARKRARKRARNLARDRSKGGYGSGKSPRQKKLIYQIELVDQANDSYYDFVICMNEAEQ